MSKSKTQLVLDHLLTHGTITSWTAIQEYRATRLSAIIFELRKQHDIMSITKKGDSHCTYKYICSISDRLLIEKYKDEQEY